MSIIKKATCTSLVLASLLLSGCGVTKTENIKPEEKKGGFLGFSVEDKIKTTSLQAIKNETNLVIPKFRIAFYTENNPGGFTSSGGHKTVINSTLTNVDNELLQKITDNAYETFVKQLKANGYNVVSKDKLSTSQTYNNFDIKESLVKDETMFGPDAIYVSPTGMKTSTSKFSKYKETQNLLKDFDSSLVEVTLYISYLTQEVEAVLNIATGINVGQVPMVTPGSNLVFYGNQAFKCTGYCPDTTATLTLGQPVYTTDKMGELRDVTGASDKIGDTVSMAASWLTGGLKFKNSKRYELIADPKKYEEAMTNVINATTQAFVDELVKNK